MACSFEYWTSICWWECHRQDLTLSQQVNRHLNVESSKEIVFLMQLIKQLRSYFNTTAAFRTERYACSAPSGSSLKHDTSVRFSGCRITQEDKNLLNHSVYFFIVIAHESPRISVRSLRQTRSIRNDTRLQSGWLILPLIL